MPRICSRESVIIAANGVSAQKVLGNNIGSLVVYLQKFVELEILKTKLY